MIFECNYEIYTKYWVLPNVWEYSYNILNQFEILFFTGVLITQKVMCDTLPLLRVRPPRLQPDVETNPFIVHRDNVTIKFLSLQGLNAYKFRFKV